LAAGKMAFQSGTSTSSIWTLPADTNQGRVTDALAKLNADNADYGWVALTPDGKTLAFSSERTGKWDVSLRDMASGQERALDADDPNKYKVWPQIDASGSEVVYTMYDLVVRYDAYVVSAHGGAKRKICGDCGPTESLSPDGTHFLVTRPDSLRSGINVVDVASGKSTLVLHSSSSRVGLPRFSPDGKWIAFLMARSGSIDVMVAPFRGETSVPEQEWITVTPSPANVNQEFWSPDGGLLYYGITSGSASLLMARHLDGSRHPVDDPFRVFEFTGGARPQSTADFLSAVPGRFIGALTQYSSNIWMMDLPK
jgi:Tol biopolymer transport system component